MSLTREGSIFALYQVLVLIFATQTVEAMQLIFANAVWRHGDRSYMKSYPNDPYKDKNIWKNGLGQLTDIGMQEQYHLGKYLRSRYDGFLSKDYLRKEIYVRSTDKDRTIMSAQSNMAGLYPPTKTEQWNGTDTAWQPVPVHVVPVNNEKLLSYPIRDCPAYLEIVDRIRHSAWYLEHEKNYSTFYEFSTSKAGVPETYNLTTIWTLEDNLVCLKANNYSLPSWATPDVVSKLQHLNSLEMGLMFTDKEGKYRKTIAKMQGGVLLKQIVKNMVDHISGISDTSLIAYSAHDTTLTALLAALNLYDWIQPGYASCVILELYKKKSSYFVKIFYRKDNGTVVALKLENCASVCPFGEFVKISDELIPDNHDKICGKLDSTPQTCNSFLLIIIATLFVYSILLSVFTIVVFKKRKNVYRAVASQDDLESI